MNELFLQTPYGNLMMDETAAKKYHLEKGVRSPFTGDLIVDENGDGARENRSAARKNSGDNTGPKSFESAGRMFTTAEVLDIAQGSDSTGGQ